MMKSNHMVVIKVRALGDTLLATPALRALRHANPEAMITVVVSSSGAEVLAGNPHVDRVLVYDKKDLLTSLGFMAQLRRSRYDLAITLHASFRTALLARATGAKKRVVHNHSGPDHFTTIPITAKKESKSAIERDLDVVRAMGIPDTGSTLEFVLEKADRLCVDGFFRQNNLAADKSFWVLAPGAGKARKRWTAGQAVAFLDGMEKKRYGPWILLSGPQEEALTREISLYAKSRPLVFQQELKEAGVLMQMSRGVVTCDSGPKHIAVAVGAKTVTLWTDEPEAEWHPYDLARHTLVRSVTGRVEDIPAKQVMQAFMNHFGK
ncbi:glycosyltransferase family 9 protein [bacterium]|nr:glycosyltransferase family 9 protein [bacterium]